MGINVDSYEDFEQTFEPHTSGGRRKPQETDKRRKARENSPEFFDEKVKKHIEWMKSEWDDLPQAEQDTRLSAYFDWIKTSLKDKEPSFEDTDLEITVNSKSKTTTVIHKPSARYGQDIGIDDEKSRLINAKDKAYIMVDWHYRDWARTSESFKKAMLENYV